MKEEWDGKSYDDEIMSPESFARFLRRRLEQGFSVEGYSYTCKNNLSDNKEIATEYLDIEEKFDILIRNQLEIIATLKDFNNPESRNISPPISDEDTLKESDCQVLYSN